MPRLMRLTSFAVILLGLGPTLRLSAQDVASGVPHNDSRMDIYGGYEYFHPVNNSNIAGASYPNVYNPNATLGLSYFLNRNFGVEAEGGYLSGNQNKPYGTCYGEACSQLVYTAEAGPILRLPLGVAVPFIHVLGGGERTNGPADQNLVWGWGLTGGAGIDLVFPFFNQHLALRPLLADFQYSHQDHGVLQPNGVTGGLGVLYDVKLSAGLVVRLGSFEPPYPMMLGCQAQPSEVYAGDPVLISSTLLHNNPKKKLTYTWSSTGGTIEAHDDGAALDTPGLAPGSYVVSGHVSQGAAAKDQAACQAPFVVKEFDPPTLTCSANPTTALTGTDIDITAAGASPQNRALTYSYAATGGVIVGTGTSAKLSTAGVAPGPVTVTCSVVDDVSHTAKATVDIVLSAPPPPPAPPTQELCSISFTRDKKRPVRVDNEAKGCLDDIAVTLDKQTDARLIMVGNAVTGEKPNAAAERTLNARQYLTQEKGIDASRIELRTGEAADKTVVNTLVPAGALFNDSTTHPFDEKTVVRHGQAYGTHLGKPKKAKAPAAAPTTP
jgi:hypothetical protein